MTVTASAPQTILNQQPMDRGHELQRAIYGFTQKIKQGVPRGQACRELSGWLAANGHEPDDLKAGFQALIADAKDPGKVWAAWSKLLTENGVLPVPTPEAAESEPSATYSASAPHGETATQAFIPEASPIVKADPSREMVIPNAVHGRLYGRNIVAELSHTVGSILISGRTGCGKSSTMRALMYGIWLKSCKEGKPARFKVIDLQDNAWLGLETADADYLDRPNYLPIVEYLNGNDGCPDNLVKGAARALRAASKEVDRRYAECQKSRRRGLERPAFEDFWLFFNEYLVAYQLWTDTSNKKQLGAHLWKTDLGNVVFRGRDVSVHICISVQDHRKEACGVSPNMARNMSLAGTGLILESGDGGYESLRYLANDSHILSTQVREFLRPALEEGIAEGGPLILTTQGVPRVGLLKDYTGLSDPKCEIGRHYPYKPQPSLGG